MQLDGATSNITLSSGSAAVAMVPTPLKVVHAPRCHFDAPTLTLQMDTVALGRLTVGGFDVAATLQALGAPGRRLQQQGPPNDEAGEGESLQGSASVSALGGVSSGRQLLSSGSTCCRSSDPTCSPTTDECTGLHEYLEKATTTHVFHDVNMCLGSDAAKWAWQFDGTTSSTTLSGRHAVTGAAEVVTVKTPLKVTHAANCDSTAPTLSLQMDTVALRSLTVGGFDVADALTNLTNMITGPPAPPNS